MQLDIKCVRDVLLALEDMSTLNDSFMPKQLTVNDFFCNDITKQYDHKLIVYTLRKLEEAGLINAKFTYLNNELYYSRITELTYDGHQLLSSISNSVVFDAVMKKIDDFGSGATLEIIKLLATKIFKEKIGL